MRGYLNNLFNPVRYGISLHRICLLGISLLGCCCAAPLATSAAPSPSKTSIVEKDDYLQREAADEQLLEQRRREFFDHISNAKNIKIAKSDTAFNWKINWPAQQRHCAHMAKEIFRKKAISFPEPIFFSTRGTVTELRDLLRREIAPLSCDSLINAVPYSERGIAPNTILGDQSEAGGWDGYTLRLYGLHQSGKINFVLEYLNPYARGRINIDSGNALIPESPIMVQGFSIYTGSHQASSGGSESNVGSCYPNEPFESVGYPSNRSDTQSVLLARIDGRMVTLEFGVYSELRFDGYNKLYFSRDIGDGSLKGRPGQGYLLLKEAGKNFTTSWAKSSPGENFSGYEQPIDLRSKEDVFSYSCVFNFDK